MINIQKLIQGGESQTLEFKSTLSDLNRIIEEICAFANTRGGKVIVGVSNNGTILGIDIGKDTLEKLTNKIVGNLDPKIYPDINIVRIENKNIIVIEVNESGSKPHFAFGRAFKRIGKSTVQLSREELEQLILEKHKDKMYFDDKFCDAKLEEIDEEKVRWFLRKAKFERNLDLDPEAPIKEALERLKLIREEKLTNAAILMFGKDPQKFFLQSEVRCARFKGIDVTAPFIDMKVIRGTVYEQIDQAEKFVLNNIKRAAWTVPGKIEREEKWEYPLDAVREAITNAITHRDYFSPAHTQVRIFEDRIEFWNPGGLPEGLTIEKLKVKHESIPINPLIAKLFFLIKYIEQWGTGTNKMIKQCLEHGLLEPEFEETGSSFIVTFRKSNINNGILEIKLNERQNKIINYLKANKNIISKQYAKLFNISESMARKDLKELVKLGILIRKGTSKKNSYYELK
ncbi:MAG: RNA-binding domain-containing protein [Methanosarcinales archaeon]